MKKEVLIVGILVFLLFSVTAQESPFSVEEGAVLEEEFAEDIVLIEERAGTTPDSPLYVVDDLVEDLNLAVRGGEDKAAYALEVKEEKVSEAVVMVEKEKEEAAIKALQKAGSVSSIIEQELGPALQELAKENAALSQRLLEAMRENTPEGWAEVEGLIDQQLTTEERIKLTADLVVKVGDYCEQLAMIDYDAMLQDRYCDPANAPTWLREAIEGEMKQREEEAKERMVEQITTCISDPRQCRCDEIPVERHRRECEENTALAIRCEFEQDMSACQELDEKPLVPEDMPDFLRPIFESTITELIAEKKAEMFSRFAPPECVEAGLSTPEECEELMRQKYGEPPEECLRDGVFIGEEECMALVIEKFDIPDECIENGRPIGREECEARMMASGGIPSECVENGEFIGRDACEERMSQQRGPGGPPPECLEDGQFIGQEECEERMGQRGVPPGGFPPGMKPPTDCPPSCAIFCEFGIRVDERGCPTCSCNEAPVGGPPFGMPPPSAGEPPVECVRDGQFVGMEECTQIMQEQFGPGGPGGPPSGFPPEGIPPGGWSPGMPPPTMPQFGEGQALIIGEGGSELVNREELEAIRQRAEQAAQQSSETQAEADNLRQEIGQLEEQRENVEQGLGSSSSESPPEESSSPEPSSEPANEPGDSGGGEAPPSE